MIICGEIVSTTRCMVSHQGDVVLAVTFELRDGEQVCFDLLNQRLVGESWCNSVILELEANRQPVLA